ncbi:helix-turn-helix domain-containing protein [Rickettsiales bacterium]|nr:helix-turn-helix domain-containing protein [Rickettsiales bacterium]
MAKLSQLKKQWIKDSYFIENSDELGPEFEVARELIRARIYAKMTQVDVATAMNTTQSVVARLESGRAIPTIKTIDRFARAVGMTFEVRLTPNGE